MRRIYLLLTSLCIAIAAAANTENYDFVSSNGLKINVEVCSDQIFRIRMTPEDSLPESLMDRYGVLKNDWSPVNAEVKEAAGCHYVSNGIFTLKIDKSDGSLSVIGKDGREIIRNVSYIPSSEPMIQEMGASLDERYAWCKQKKPIIGNTRKVELADTNDVGETSSNSMLGFDIIEGERFYGGGNTSHEHIQHRGEILRMWAREMYTGMPVPFMMSSNGWAVLTNTTFRHYFDIGVTDKDKMWIYNTVPYFDFYLFLGSSMKENIRLYTDVTGKATLLPAWAYGSSFAGIQIEDVTDVMNDAVRFRDEKIPMDMIWIEPQWMSKHYDYSTGKDWNFDKFPGVPFYQKDSRAECKQLFIGRLHSLGYKVALWLCVEIDHSIDEEDDIAAATGGRLSGKGHWFDHLTKFIDQGIDGFKLDPGSTQEEHVRRKYYNGRTDAEMHNLNQVLMPKRMYLTFRNHTGGRRSFHHYCGAWSGTQRWTASTCGDIGGGPNAMYEQVNLSMSGFLNTSCDAMGSNDEMRALHMAAFLPWVEINGWMSLLQPWYYSKKDKATYADYIRLRHSLFPYIYSEAVRGATTGEPMLKAMPLAFPDDRNVDDMVNEFLLGDNLLVGVFRDSTMYIPEGEWVDYWTGVTYHGDGNDQAIDIPDNRAGYLFARKGSIIPYQKDMDFIGEFPLDTLIIKVYPDGESRYDLYEDDGMSYKYEDGEVAVTTFECSRNGKATTFTVNPVEGHYDGMYKSRTYEMEFHDIPAPRRVRVNGEKRKDWIYEDGTLGITVSQDDTSGKLSLTIE